MTFFNLARTKSFNRFCRNIPLIFFNLFFLLERFRGYKAPTYFSVCFSNTFPKQEYENLACSIICLWLKGNISSPVRYSYSSIFPGDNADAFAASQIISYCSFWSLILSIVMISFYFLSKRFFLKQGGLSDARVASIIKKKCSCVVNLLYRFIKFWKSISDEWLNTNCLSSHLLGLFIIK